MIRQPALVLKTNQAIVVISSNKGKPEFICEEKRGREGENKNKTKPCSQPGIVNVCTFLG